MFQSCNARYPDLGGNSYSQDRRIFNPTSSSAALNNRRQKGMWSFYQGNLHAPSGYCQFNYQHHSPRALAPKHEYKVKRSVSLNVQRNKNKTSAKTERDTKRKHEYETRKFFMRQLPFSQIGIRAFHEIQNLNGVIKQQLKAVLKKLDVTHTIGNTPVQNLSHDNCNIETNKLNTKISKLTSELESANKHKLEMCLDFNELLRSKEQIEKTYENAMLEIERLNVRENFLESSKSDVICELIEHQKQIEDLQEENEHLKHDLNECYDYDENDFCDGPPNTWSCNNGDNFYDGPPNMGSYNNGGNDFNGGPPNTWKYDNGDDCYGGPSNMCPYNNRGNSFNNGPPNNRPNNSGPVYKKKFRNKSFNKRF
ncbi:hypothetical protein SNE40_017992 [Patella caerulea]|uniref:Uncharacterized protein n=1 Tax=Patella caerulea TaxID=87958 RepID=A0AAN8PF44_PATCE